MNPANVHAGRLERRVRRVGRETMPGVHGFCSLIHSAQYAEYRYCTLYYVFALYRVILAQNNTV
ncbi:MAG: hypothetical protein WCI11_16640 [Candidatus Methylumidiphilus sp.]